MQLESSNDRIIGKTLDVLVKNGEKSFSSIPEKLIKQLIDQYKKKNGFSLTDSEDVGLITQAIGGKAILLLANGMNYDLKKNEEAKYIVLEVFDFIKNHIKENGFNYTPFISIKKVPFIQKGNAIYSIESLVAVFSFFLKLRIADQNRRIDLTVLQKKDLLDNLKKIFNLLKEAIVIDDGKKDGWLESKPETLKVTYVNSLNKKSDLGWGWGCINQCDEPSIYYTSITLEVLMEFEEYIKQGYLNNTLDEELLSSLGCSFNGESFVSNANDNAVKVIFEKDGVLQNAVHWIWYSYNEMLLSGQFKGSMEYQNDIIYYFLFVLEIIILGHGRLINIKSENILEVLDSGYFYINKRMSGNLLNKNASYKVEFFGIKDNLSDDLSDKIKRTLNNSMIIGTVLVPLRIRVGNLITNSFTMYPDKKMSYELDNLLEDKSKEGWYWDRYEYNLLATEKAIESIIDFYQYYTKFEEQYIDQEERAKKSKEEALEKERIILHEQFSNEIEKLKKERDEAEKSARYNCKNELTFENYLTKHIHDVIEHEYDTSMIKKSEHGMFEEKFLHMMERLYNEFLFKSNEPDDLDKHFINGIDKLFISYLFFKSELEKGNDNDQKRLKGKLDKAFKSLLNKNISDIKASKSGEFEIEQIDLI